MDDLERLQEREFAQSRLVNGLKGKIMEMEDRFGQKVMATSLMFFCSNYLLRKGRDKLTMSTISFGTFTPNVALLESNISPLIAGFSPIEEERCVIIAKLLEWSTQTIAQEFHGDLLAFTQNHRAEFLKAVGL